MKVVAFETGLNVNKAGACMSLRYPAKKERSEWRIEATDKWGSWLKLSV